MMEDKVFIVIKDLPGALTLHRSVDIQLISGGTKFLETLCGLAVRSPAHNNSIGYLKLRIPCRSNRVGGMRKENRFEPLYIPRLAKIFSGIGKYLEIQFKEP